MAPRLNSSLSTAKRILDKYRNRPACFYYLFHYSDCFLSLLMNRNWGSGLNSFLLSSCLSVPWRSLVVAWWLKHLLLKRSLGLMKIT